MIILLSLLPLLGCVCPRAMPDRCRRCPGWPPDSPGSSTQLGPHGDGIALWNARTFSNPTAKTRSTFPGDKDQSGFGLITPTLLTTLEDLFAQENAGGTAGAGIVQLMGEKAQF